MTNSIIKRIFVVFALFLFVFTLSSCGKYDAFYNEVNALQVQVSFPEPTVGATELSEAEEYVRQLQILLAGAYADAYKITESEGYLKKYDGLEKDKLISELSNRRSEINYDSEVLFVEKIRVALQDVGDITNVDAYILKQIEDVKGFYRDYIKFEGYTEENFDEVTSILVNYYNTGNDFAKWMLTEKELFVAECAILAIENNSKVTQGHSAALQENNEIVTAINELFGGVHEDTQHSSRIRKANKALTSHLNERAQAKQKQLAELETQ